MSRRHWDSVFPFAFPFNDPMIRHPPSLHGVPRVGSPASAVLCRRSDFRRPIRTSFLASYVRTRHSTRNRRISQVPEWPQCKRARLCDPGGMKHLWPFEMLMLPSATSNASAPAMIPFSRLNHSARLLPVYASQLGSPQDHATLGSGCWPALPGEGSISLGHDEEFPMSSYPLSLSPFSGFPGAHSFRNEL